MDADRIKELRDIAWQNDVNALSGHTRGLARLMSECLDEIERLQAENEQLKFWLLRETRAES